MARHYRCSKYVTCSNSTGWIILAAILASLGITGFIVSMYTTHSYISRHRYCVHASNKRMPTGVVGSPDGYVGGQIVFDASREVVEYDFHTYNLSAVEAIHVIGPTPIDDPFDGPLHIVLCGLPSQTGCLEISPNRLKATVNQDQNGHGIGLPIKEQRDQPERYRVLFKTDAHPDGAVSYPLTRRC